MLIQVQIRGERDISPCIILKNVPIYNDRDNQREKSRMDRESRDTSNIGHAWLYAKIGILLLCGKHLHDDIISLKGKLGSNKLVEPRHLY